MTLRAYAIHNDLDIFVTRNMTAVFDAATCDEQRDFAARIWQKWTAMGRIYPYSADLTIRSYTGRVIASLDPGRGGSLSIIATNC